MSELMFKSRIALSIIVSIILNMGAEFSNVLWAQGDQFSCEVPKKLCADMRSCAEACFYFDACDMYRLDRDNDGIPCEALCLSVKGSSFECPSYLKLKIEPSSQPSAFSIPIPEGTITMPPFRRFENECQIIHFSINGMVTLTCQTPNRDQTHSRKVKLLGVEFISISHRLQALNNFGTGIESALNEKLKGIPLRIEPLGIGEDLIQGQTVSGYIWLINDEKLLNLLLIESGIMLASVENHKYLTLFWETQQKAQQNKKGMWAFADVNGEQGICNIKGIIGYGGVKYYLLPNSKLYSDFTVDVLQGGRWFCSETEAIALDWKNLKD